MMAPHLAHQMTADALHAERLATAARHRLAATQLHPTSGRPRVQVQRHRVAAAMASLVMAVVLATAVSAAVDTDQPTAASNAASAAGAAGGGGAILHR